MIAEELDMRYTTPIPVCIYSCDKSLLSHAVIRFPYRYPARQLPKGTTCCIRPFRIVCGLYNRIILGLPVHR